MGKIFCLMGKSSSGKDTLFKNLIKENELGLLPVVSYTTRPMRTNEVEGREYHFITKEQLEGYKATDKMIEHRVYETVHGPWHYATIDDGQIDLESHNYLMIVTLEAYNNLVKYFGEKKVVPLYVEVEDGLRLERAILREKQQHNYLMIVTLEAYNNLVKYFGEKKVVPLYVEVEDGLRLERAILREKQQVNPNYEEICRRFLADSKDFSKERLEESKILYCYNNMNLELCKDEMKAAILKAIDETT